MKVKIVNIDWFLDKENREGTVTFIGRQGMLINAFSYGCNYEIDSLNNIDLSSIDSDLTWENIFNNNPSKFKTIKKIKDWTYEAYGQIKSINPVIIDFGEFVLETGNWTNDINVIDEYVYWFINRLNVNKA